MRNKAKIIQDITAITAAISGVPAVLFNGNSRVRRVVTGRMAFGNFLIRELDFTHSELERFTNRDRCSYYYYESKHDDNYKFISEYKELYDSIHSAYYGDTDNNITKEDIVSEMIINNIGDKSFLSDFKIKFILGGHETIIFCKDLSGTIDKLNITFSNYDFTFKVSHVNSLRYE